MSSSVPEHMIPVYKCVVQGFISEYHGQYDKALEEYKTSIDLLVKIMPTIKKNNLKVHRKMYERQLEVLLERKAVLDQAARANPPFAGVIAPPTILSADAEVLAAQNGNHFCLSLDQKLLSDHDKALPKGMDLKVYRSTAPDNIKRLLSDNVPKFTPTLDASLTPTVYNISIDSELVNLGLRSYWAYVKDATKAHTLYALQIVWNSDAPITEAVLRRSGEFLPAAGAVHVDIRRTAPPGGGAYWLAMKDPQGSVTLELPDRVSKTRSWSPRRFTYGGRKFVWKAFEDGKLITKFQWDTLYEYSRTWPVEGSKTGKQEDEVVGDRLCWGETDSRRKQNYTIYMAGGLDQHFREHLLASQLTRYFGKTWGSTSKNESSGMAAAGGVASVLSVAASFL
ncbi:hypothetical protein AUEXF2481DRAFT_167383 [Aureobasidium subglaciale EXF-2481]|uniref:MIT domain-containing protein n=1 Tax=Aureobasidium subglaciale (strain EXF-2481) TaxID=1043005 RepID=A0A074ZRL1_AURSE|nr:uncharacterized protein AUEXF2481DRAFT_167383 [Aureobasidium subglaciale EXF-2481]KAI5200188.1 hypothetical protein E4T38_06615 [Aureobasidium subglaciale]KAI5218020.1 hypothetical protein E4T40_07114 [Aureobasidium subglaciale]KAI5221662.1 hypothetical protein E4T41_07034 [Aureobasidium subglaciale]KAI5259111.1 hypothetical protein E4T46_07012 [Aureobasidium subglaciale]KER00917.1 hypothetical protein AUEXF2481DRAFT_167383 [Aureobasidium subglaciale EXF-2481]